MKTQILNQFLFLHAKRVECDMPATQLAYIISGTFCVVI